MRLEETVSLIRRTENQSDAVRELSARFSFAEAWLAANWKGLYRLLLLTLQQHDD